MSLYIRMYWEAVKRYIKYNYVNTSICFYKTTFSNIVNQHHKSVFIMQFIIDSRIQWGSYQIDVFIHRRDEHRQKFPF